MSQKFSPEEDEKLVDLVKEHPSLYQVKSRSYKDAVVKNNIWKEIGNKMEGKTGNDCKGRWKSIRDYYQRKKRDYLKGTGTGSAKEDQEDNFSKKFKNLRFLDSTSMVERRTISSNVEEHPQNETEPEEIENREEFTQQPSEELQNKDGETEDLTESVEISQATDEIEANFTQKTPQETPEASSSGQPPAKRKKSCSFIKDKHTTVLEEIKKGVPSELLLFGSCP